MLKKSEDKSFYFGSEETKKVHNSRSGNFKNKVFTIILFGGCYLLGLLTNIFLK